MVYSVDNNDMMSALVNWCVATAFFREGGHLQRSAGK